MIDKIEQNPGPGRVAAGRRFLEEGGMDLFHAFDVAGLPADLGAALDYAGSGSWRLFLLGASGSVLWERAMRAKPASADPVDDYSIGLGRHFASRFLAAARSEILYPGPAPIALQRLGELAGFSLPSPLGLGINPERGPWFAWRVLLIAIDCEWPASPAPVADLRSPCLTCAHTPCVTACPAGAVSARAPFDISACAGFRLGGSPVCRRTCLARVACPIGGGHRYTSGQLGYFMERALDSMAAHAGSGPGSARVAE